MATVATTSLSPPLLHTPTASDRRHARYIQRQLYTILGGSFAGVILGGYTKSKAAALRFRAENAHRLPTSTKGWYLYHKSKNYVTMWAAIRGGASLALKMGFWTGAFVAVEESVDRCRYTSGNGDPDDKRVEGGDMLSSVVAGLAVAGGFSLWNRFPMVTAGRTAKVGLAVGAVYGALQDVVRVARGRRVGYVEAVRRWRRGEGVRG